MYSTVGLYHMPNTVHKTKHLSLLSQSLCCRKIVSDTALCNSSWWIQYTQSHKLRKLGTRRHSVQLTDKRTIVHCAAGWSNFMAARRHSACNMRIPSQPQRFTTLVTLSDQSKVVGQYPICDRVQSDTKWSSFTLLNGCWICNCVTIHGV